LADAIIGELTVRLTDLLSQTSQKFQRESDEQKVKIMLEQEQNTTAVQETINLVNDIH